jgi:hypothetical protein
VTQPNDDPILRVSVEGPTVGDLRAFIDEVEPDLGCRAVAKQSSSGYTIDIYLSQSRLAAARNTRSASGISLQVVANETENGLTRQQEVGTGDRFAARGDIPRGLGRKE